MIIFDLEGDLFFGAAPELDGYLAGLEKRVIENGIRCIVLRLKRTNSPDMVCMERFHHFILDMDRRGGVVILCGVRPDFARIMKNMRFEDVLPESRVFLEEPVLYSSTLKAVRRILRFGKAPPSQNRDSEGLEGVRRHLQVLQRSTTSPAV